MSTKQANQSGMLARWFRAIVPGIITAAVVFGPSKMTVTSKMGAEYGNSLLWVIVIPILFMAVYTAMAARIGRASSVSLLALVRQKWGRTVALIIGIGIFLVTTSFQAGNAVGAGIAMAELTKTPMEVWVLFFSAASIALLFFKAFYRILEKVMISIIVLMLLSFVATCVVVKPELSAVLDGLHPVIPEGSLPLIIAFMASAFSLVGALYQAYLVQEKARNLQLANNEVEDKSLTGILLLGFMSACVMICAASVLHTQGLHIESAADMGRSLEPLFGSFATGLFLVGLLGAAVSSLIGNATVGGTLLSDALGKGFQMDKKGVKVYIALVMVAGASIALLFGGLPLELIVFAQRVTIFIVPAIGLAIYAISNDKAIMGDLVNGRWSRVMGLLGLVLVFVLAVVNFRQLFF
ncbi:MAG: divalent metal cation transporter [Parapedobacter sp.]|nr:MAG: divalent metal cation transporter [Parapedobacter sp.]